MTPRLSLIIPARNEENNLPTLLWSIQNQSSENIEIIVVDDGSEDGTALIAEKLGAQVLASKSLPPGWTGKAWACQQGAEYAKGEVLIFLDADTWFEKNGLTQAMELFYFYNQLPLSILPFHHTRFLYETLSLFFNVLLSIGVLGKGSLSGQSLWIRREDYLKTGGHESVRGEVLENYFLARRLFRRGLTPLTLPGKGILSMRMYPDGIPSLIQGWSKAFARGRKNVPFSRMALSALWMSAGWMSFLGIFIAFAFFPSAVPLAIAFYCFYALQLGWVARKFANFELIGFLFYPVPLIFFQAVYSLSHHRQKSGKPILWRGRDVSSGI